MAQLIFASGRTLRIVPNDGIRFTADEIADHVADTAYVVSLDDGRFMVCVAGDVFFNIEATKLLPDGTGFNVSGTALLIEASEVPESEPQ